MDDTWQQGKGGRKDEMTRGRPTLVKHRAAEDDMGHAIAIDLGTSIVAVGKLHMRFRTPPLRLKVERWGGSGMVFIAIDPGALI
jgi:hypothetical protein